MRAATLTDPAVVPVWNLQRSFRLERVRAAAARRASCTLQAPPADASSRCASRCADARQAEAISRAKRQDASLGLPGVVTLYELPGGAAERDTARFRAILDGQHRVGALRLLSRGSAAAAAAAADAPPSPWERVLVEVYPLQSERNAEALFTEINSAQPVMLVDLPPSAGGAPAADKSALEGAAAALAGAWRASRLLVHRLR